MAISQAEYRQLLAEYRALRTELRSNGVRSQQLLDQFRALLPRLESALADGFSDLASNSGPLQETIRNISFLENALANPPANTTTSAAQDAQAAAATDPVATPPQVAQASTGQVSDAPSTIAPTNAVVPATTNAGGGDSGTNAPVRTLEQTQSVPAIGVDAQGRSIGIPLRDETGATGTIRRNSETGELYDSGSIYAPATPGLGSQDDASAVAGIAETTNTLGVSATLDTGPDSLRIVPRPNVLDRFSSYTYRASWYLMTPVQYRELVLSRKRQINGYMLLMQSGGAPVNSGGAKGSSAADPGNLPGPTGADAGRNPFFPQDFYFDSITIDNFIIGAGSRAAHSASDLKFSVVEPGNITLLDRLYEAVQDFLPASSQQRSINYTAVTYLMVIRFYGYDENGKLVTNIGAADNSGKTDPNAVIEKFIPFKIAKCDWGIDNGLVTYNFEAKPPNLIVAAGTRRGTVPYDIQLTAKSIGDLLGGNGQFIDETAPESEPGASTTPVDGRFRSQRSDVPPPRTANAARSPKKILSQGLMGAMNAFQQELVKQGVYEFPDTYKIVFAQGGPGGGGQAIEKAKLIPPGAIDKRNLPTVPPGTTDVQSAEMAKIFSDVTARNYSITAGMQVVQAIDLAIRNSEYIYGQQLKYFNEDNNNTTPDEQSANGTGRDVTWYNITFEALPKPDQYDSKRNDFAYDITFVINTYTPVNFVSNFFPLNRFRGVHKAYSYWFTGKNNSVLEYKESLNNLYNLTISGSADAKSFAQRQLLSSSIRDQPFYNFQAASNESRQGAAGKENEPGSNLAEYLYDPKGLADASVRIVGDPAWLQQGSFSTGIDPASFQFNPFFPDGTINFDASEILFEIAWQRPEDYDLNTGLADPYAKSSQRQPVQSRIYTATKVSNEFNKGSFTQTLTGKLYWFIKPNLSNKATNAPAPSATAGQDSRPADTTSDGSFDRAEAARLARNAPTPNLRGRIADPVSSVVGALGSAAKGALTLPLAAVAVGRITAGIFNAARPGPKDQVQPAPPPVPATSGTGENLSVGDPFVPPDALTAAAQSNTLDRLQAAVQGQRPEIQAIQSNPQDIVRDY